MARGTIAWRCWRCRKNTTKETCHHPGAKYYIAYCLGQQQKWEPVGRNKKEAERRLSAIMIDLQQGTFRLPQPLLFSRFSEQWLRDYARAAVKPLTLRLYRILTRVHLDPEFGGLELTKIRPQHAQGFLARCLREKELAPKTTNTLLLLLKMMLKHAKQWGYLRENPAENITPVKVQPKEMAFLCPDEIPLLLRQADEPYRTLFLTAILTGMRRGELLGLQWGDIDWHNNRIHVRRTLYYHTKDELAEQQDQQKWRFSTPKSARSIRTVDMSPKLREALELHRLVCPRSPYDLIFCTKDGKPLHAENMVKREFLPTLSRAGLRRIRFHDLRHTYTTLLIAQGENVKLIQSQLGHASIETTMDRYGHLLPEAQRHVGERLDAQIFGSGQEAPAKVLLKKQAKLVYNKEGQRQHPSFTTATGVNGCTPS